MNNNNHVKAYVVAVNMGYGHQRAAYPLKDIAEGGIINANDYKGIPESDRKIWESSRMFYEFISRFKKVPIVGEFAFDMFDKFQSIKSFYPKRDLSDSIIQVDQMYRLMKKRDWGKHLIQKLEKKPLPIITTFFSIAFMAEFFKYSGDIFCLATDTDISRSWAPPNPATSRIKYLAPTFRVQERLKLYGIKESNIYLTGFPLPNENVGGESLGHLRKDLSQRLSNLDPDKKYWNSYKDSIMENIGERYCIYKAEHPLTIMFAVGGAGAQRDIGIEITDSLKNEIKQGKIRVVLVAGIHNDVANFFKKGVKAIGLGNYLGKSIIVIHGQTKDEYFKRFNKMLRTTDILWTKPSELSFYTALGIPIIMSPSIGSQEDYNRKWLMTIGSGIDQEDIRYTNQWLFDWLKSGWFAEAAMQGFMEAPRYGTYNIKKIVGGQLGKMKDLHTICQY